MLLASQVLPFLTHSEQDVRNLASRYLRDMGEAAPVETAQHLWNAIDRFGEVETEFEFKERQRFFSALSQAPIDDSCVTRTLEVLKNLGLNDEESFALRQVVQAVPLGLLKARKEEIFSACPAEIRARLEHRLLLATLDPDDLWQQLLQLEGIAEKAHNSREIDFGVSDRLIHALSTHADWVTPHAISVLENPQERWWLEIWCVELLGEIRCSEAADLLIKKMQIEDADVLREAAGQALTRLDATLVVPKIEAAHASDDPFYRMAITGILGNIKHPNAEAALLRILPGETNKTALADCCASLCDLCTTDGLEPLRQVVLADRYDTTVADIKKLVVTLAQMTGFNPPEMPQWTAELADPAYKTKLRNHVFKSYGIDHDTANLFQKYLSHGELDGPEPEEPSLRSGPPQPGLPYRREEPKVGRNDPCPCGSGKKYKKCCGG